MTAYSAEAAKRWFSRWKTALGQCETVADVHSLLAAKREQMKRLDADDYGDAISLACERQEELT